MKFCLKTTIQNKSGEDVTSYSGDFDCNKEVGITLDGVIIALIDPESLSSVELFKME